MKAHAIGIFETDPVTTVAVKMPKPPVSKTQLMAMMAEIKIMLHMGKHLNIVNLLGACTMDLAKREQRSRLTRLLKGVYFSLSMLNR